MEKSLAGPPGVQLIENEAGKPSMLFFPLLLCSGNAFATGKDGSGQPGKNLGY
jgi:hypothetical protein